MSLRAVNLNLLPVLRALLTERNVSRASVILGLSQPATSNALGRLRSLLGDPLLVQTGRRMHLTPRARQMLPALEELCAGIETLIQNPMFDPQQAERKFVLATPDYVAFLVGSELQEIIRTEAPRVTVQFVDARIDFKQRLLQDDYDVAIVAWHESLTADLSNVRGYFDRMVGVVARNHPLANTRPTITDLNAYPALIVNPGTEVPISNDLPPISFGGQTRIIAEQFMVLPLLATKSDGVAIVPSALAEYFLATAPISILQLPGDKWHFEVGALWSPAQSNDLGHRWFREIVKQSMERQFGRFCIGGLSRNGGKRID